MELWNDWALSNLQDIFQTYRTLIIDFLLNEAFKVLLHQPYSNLQMRKKSIKLLIMKNHEFKRKVIPSMGGLLKPN